MRKYVKIEKKIEKKIGAIVLGVCLFWGSLFGNIPGTMWNVLEVQATESQLPNVNEESVAGEDRILLIRSEADLNSWLAYKRGEAGQRIAQTITRLEISGITSIPDYAFANLGNLNTIVFRENTPPELGKEVFYGERSRTVQIWVPGEALNNYDSILGEIDNSGLHQLGHSGFYVKDIFHDPIDGGEEILLPGVGAPGESATQPSINQISGSYHHSHTWIQKEHISATATEDALVVPICQECGVMDSMTKRPGSAHVRFLKDTAQQIIDAEVNATIMVTSELWFSTNHLITDAMAARKDVSLTINYKYEGKYYTVTIPAGTDMAALLGENGWVGFRYVDSVFPGRELMPEEWKDLRK